MNNIKQFTVRYQMAIFVFLAYLLSWVYVIPGAGLLIPQGPMIAAFIVLAVVAGRPGVAGLWRQIIRWRVGWIWYLITPGIFIALHLCALAINLMLGAQITNTDHLGSLPVYLSLIVPLVLFGGQWEEPGWTGYALERYQRRFSQNPLIATLAVGIVRMFWHTPLLLYGHIPWYDYLFYSFALQIIITWLYNRAGSSVLIVMIAHFFSNVLFATMYPLFESSDQGQYTILMVLAAWAIVVVIFALSRGKLGFKPDSEPAPTYSAELPVKG